MILVAFEPLGQQRSVNPRDWRAIALHPDEQCVHISDFAMHMAIHFRRDVARVGGKEELVFIELQQVSGFGHDVEIAMLAKEGQGGNGTLVERNRFHLADIDYVAESAALQKKPEGRILQRSAVISRDYDVANSVAELQQRFKQDVILVVVGN